MGKTGKTSKNKVNKKSTRGKLLFFDGLEDEKFEEFVDKLKPNRSTTYVASIGSFKFDIHRVIKGSKVGCLSVSPNFPSKLRIPVGIKRIIIPIVFEDENVAYTEKEKEENLFYTHVAVVGVDLVGNGLLYFDNRIVDERFTFFRQAVESNLPNYLIRQLKNSGRGLSKLSTTTFSLHPKKQHGIPNGCGVVASWIVKMLLEKDTSKWGTIKLPADALLIRMIINHFPYRYI